MTKPLLRILCSLGAAFLGTLLVTACGGSNDDDLDDRLDIADPKVRFVHAIPLPAALNVSLYRNDAKQADVTNVAYKFASRYFDVAEGNATWTLKTETNPTIDLGSIALDAHRGDKYTFVALPGSSAADFLLIEDPYNKSLTSNEAHVRVVNAAFNAASVDVYLTAEGADLAPLSPTFAAVAYKTSNPGSGADSREMNGGSFQLRVTTAGTKTVIFSKTVVIGNNADWLITTIADEGIGAVTPNDIRVLLVKADDDTNAATELISD